ncbi:ATP-dependent helicase BRM [Nymphaea colorata]|nr:ATP-dependent helicase BRM [Nymphaea colorata]
MQQGSQQGGGGAAPHGRNPPPCRSSSASPSPSSSSSAVSAPHLGFDSLQHPQFQQRQPLQQAHLRKPEGDDSLIAYQTGSNHGILGGSSFPSSSMMPFPQQSRKFIDISQQQNLSQVREENQVKVQSLEEQVQSPAHQAYLQYAFQNCQQKTTGNMQVQQQMKGGMIGPSSKDQEAHINNMKMQELISIQAANQMQGSMFKKSNEHVVNTDRKLDQGQVSGDQRGDMKAPQAVIGQLTAGNMMRPVQASQAQPSMQNMANNQLAILQLQAVQAWAMEHNVDLSLPSNANLVAQLLPIWQSKIAAIQKANEGNTGSPQPRLPTNKLQGLPSPPVNDRPSMGNENSVHGSSVTEASVQAGPAKAQPTFPGGSFPTSGTSKVVNSTNAQMLQTTSQSRENHVEKAGRHAVGNGVPIMQLTQTSAPTSQSMSQSIPEMQMQNLRQLQQLNRYPLQSVALNEGLRNVPSQTSSLNQTQRLGFTKQQLHVLKAQIMAFRRLKKGDGVLPQDILQSISPPPLNTQPLQTVYPASGTTQERNMAKGQADHGKNLLVSDKAQVVPPNRAQPVLKEETAAGEEKTTISSHSQGAIGSGSSQPVHVGVAKDVHNTAIFAKPDREQDGESNRAPPKSDFTPDKGKSSHQHNVPSDNVQAKKITVPATTPAPKDVNIVRKYSGPIFDSPYFTKKHDSFSSATSHVNNIHALSLGYDIKDLLLQERSEVDHKKRSDNLKKIGCLLAVNLDRKRIRPDLILRLQIEEKKLRLLDLQARIREEVDQQQQEIMAMPDRPYRKFVRQCERQRVEIMKQLQLSQRVAREKQLKTVFQWRKKLLEAHWAIRDARNARNRGVAKYHERMLREFSKRKDEDRTKRMEALKNNDVDRYREMLLEQQTNTPGDAAQRYAVLSSFLSQTEEYLHKLGGKIRAVKCNQEVEEASLAAAAAARAQGLSEEEVKAVANCAGKEVMIRNRFSEMNARKDNKYYNLAHAVNERIIKQPSLLRAGTLRDYQLVGLQWMLSLYNNKLNGILADEMGLGKTVQVMALMAYLMEFKGNYGPHLIIVPNAVMVNWKSELHNWLPSVSCIYYVGNKDERMKLYTQEVCAMKFNALVTTYEFVMNDRSKLSKVEWKYIIIDEAQRMKNRNSRLARDLDRYRCQRRLLLTGTPLQNDLKELWSLLNLLLPEVFDNRKAFYDWFSQPFQKDGQSQTAEDDWLETEKKVIIIHRLHQILEPFMLRRRVEDVEGSLPPKVPVVLRCRMSAVQSAIYDWIKATGSKKADPQEELTRVSRNPNRQMRQYVPLQNRCMELHKVCNHPLLCYPFLTYYAKDYIVRSCGKLWMLDRILIKLYKTGHRVLLFSTMTKLLDILEDYLQWRRLVYRRIDGTTSLEDRESAIVDFNSPDSDCFIFLLSIRAAGRGLNLQSADTVVIYDPDANPKNEEQAVARAHRIGQKREVRVIYMEAVVDTISSYQKEDDFRSGAAVDLEDDLAGKDRYIGSIESLVRNNIQQYKIDMADEVINAGRFDQRTTQEERRMTLELLLRDEERYQETVHDVPSLQEVNRMIARSEEEIELFDRMDEELNWTGDMIKFDEVPKWLRASTREVNAVIASLSKKASKYGLIGNAVAEVEEDESRASPKVVRRRGRPKGSSNSKKLLAYQQLDDGEENDASSDDKNGYDEEEETGGFEDEDVSRELGDPMNNKDLYEEDLQTEYDGEEATRNDRTLEEAVSSGSSSESCKVTQDMTATISCQKFGSLSALDARPGSVSKCVPVELEEGEIAVDSNMDVQQSGSWIHDRDDYEDEQALQPKIKRKRSIRLRPRGSAEKVDDKSSGDKAFLHQGNSSQLTNHATHTFESPLRADLEVETLNDSMSGKNDIIELSYRQRSQLASKRGAHSSNSQLSKNPKINSFTGADDPAENSKGIWEKASHTSSPPFIGKQMSDINQRKCKNVFAKLQRTIDKEGHLFAPILTDILKRSESSVSVRGSVYMPDMRKIEQRLDKSEYGTIMEFVADVQFMLNNAIQCCGYPHEAKSDARKILDLFFSSMKAAFPDIDFREARSLASFTGPGASVSPSPRPISQGAGSSASPSPRQISQGPGASSCASPRRVGQGRMQKPLDDLNHDHGSRLGHMSLSADDHILDRALTSKLHKESRNGSSSRERGISDDVDILTHPGDLVVCKKKRKDRDKSAIKARMVQVASPPDASRPVRLAVQKDASPVSPPPPQQARRVHGWLQSPSPSSGNGAGKSSESGVKEAQWARPVKRLRTDAGKRRPSHI